MMRRRKRADGTYSAEHSYHSSEDEEGKARRRRRRRERRHGADSAHSYYRYAYYSTSCVVSFPFYGFGFGSCGNTLITALVG